VALVTEVKRRLYRGLTYNSLKAGYHNHATRQTEWPSGRSETNHPSDRVIRKANCTASPSASLLRRQKPLAKDYGGRWRDDGPKTKNH
jgi:hypothetical protein